MLQDGGAVLLALPEVLQDVAAALQDAGEVLLDVSAVLLDVGEVLLEVPAVLLATGKVSQECEEARLEFSIVRRGGRGMGGDDPLTCPIEAPALSNPPEIAPISSPAVLPDVLVLAAYKIGTPAAFRIPPERLPVVSRVCE